MYYSIGEVSKLTGLASSTLRYYDKEGLLPSLKRQNGGIRAFTDMEIGALKVIECLKSTGLSIKEIKQYMDWHEEGDQTLEKRQNLFYEQLDVVNQQLAEIEKIKAMIEYKCWYYDTALSHGSEKPLKQLKPDDLPPEIKELHNAFL